MINRQLIAVVLGLHLTGLPAFAQTQQQEQVVRGPLSETLGLVGVVVALSGIGMMTPNGQEHRVLGTTYCVSNRGRDVDYGGCGRSDEMKHAGLLMLGFGSLATVIGYWPVTRRVVVSPSRQGIGALVTVKWGGQ